MEPLPLTRDLPRELNKKFLKVGYRVAPVPGPRHDRLVVQSLALLTDPQPLLVIDRETGHVMPPDSREPWRRVLTVRAGTKRLPVVRYRAAEDREFARLVADADPNGWFLRYEFSYEDERAS